MGRMENMARRVGLGTVYTIVRAAISEFGEDRAGRQAAALAYYSLFSVVPLLFVAVAITAITVGPARSDLPTDPATGEVQCSAIAGTPIDTTSDRPLDRVVAQLHSVAGDAVSDPVRVIICEARKNASTSLSIGLLVAAFAASGIFLQVQGVLNWVFKVPDEKVSGIWKTVRQRLVALASALVLAVLVVIPVIAVATVQFVVGLLPSGLSWLSAPIGFVVPLASLALLVGVVSLTFQALTAARIPWQAARRGGVATSLAGLLAAFLVGQYLGRFGSGSSTFGVLGGLAILLFFFNLMWVVYVFGAEVTKVYSDYLEFGTVMAPHEREESRFATSLHEAIGEMRSAEEAPSQRTVASGMMALVLGYLIGRRRRD